MSKPKAICVRELNGVASDYVTDAPKYNGRLLMRADGNEPEKFNQPLITAPTYLHEWWVNEMQVFDGENPCEAFERNDFACAKWIQLMEFRRIILHNTGYDIATNTITTESEGEDE